MTFWLSHNLAARSIIGLSMTTLPVVLGPTLLGMPSTAAAQTSSRETSADRIARLVRQLGDDRYTTRLRAERELARIGEPAVPALARAVRSRSAEVRLRARRLLNIVQHELLLRKFRRLADEEDDARINLTDGMLLISQVVDPTADSKEVTAQLDALANKVRKRLGANVDPKRADPKQLMKALGQVLFVEEKFIGNRDDYDNPGNSSLERVLATRRGLPILLAHVVVCVADRLGVPLVGLAVPHRYMVKYDGQRAPPGLAKSDIIMDPYDGGKIVTVDDLEDIVARLGGGFDPLRHLTPATHRETLARMLRNLQNDYSQAGDAQKEQQVGKYLELFEEEP